MSTIYAIQNNGVLPEDNPRKTEYIKEIVKNLMKQKITDFVTLYCNYSKKKHNERKITNKI